MYKIINSNISLILGNIKESSLQEYSYLVGNVDQCLEVEYQKRYKTFWRLNPARLSDPFCNRYFSLLHNFNLSQGSLKQLLVDLQKIPCNNGTNAYKLHFSFASKLIHTAKPNKPIYDKMVASFYFYRMPPNKKN